jgi:hypothetical protein
MLAGGRRRARGEVRLPRRIRTLRSHRHYCEQTKCRGATCDACNPAHEPRARNQERAAAIKLDQYQYLLSRNDVMKELAGDGTAA